MGDKGATNTAAIAVAGATTTAIVANVETWNGTNWTEVADVNQGRIQLVAAGTSTSAVAFGSRYPVSSRVTSTEIWNGSNWTEVNNMNTAGS